MATTAADQRNVVAVTLDVHGCRVRGVEEAVVAATIAFCRALLALDPATDVALLAAHTTSAPFLFRSSSDCDGDSQRAALGPAARAAIAALPFAEESSASAPLLSAALSRALCFVTRRCARRGVAATATATSAGRVLCVHASADDGAQYVALMNAAFAAQRARVPVDACVLSSAHSPLLQQSAHLTGGVYLKPDPSFSPESLLQTMLCGFAPSVHARAAVLAMPGLPEVDTRPACFCHRVPVDQGFVCSVCLSVFCKFTAICPTCGSRFWLPTIAAK